MLHTQRSPYACQIIRRLTCGSVGISVNVCVHVCVCVCTCTRAHACLRMSAQACAQHRVKVLALYSFTAACGVRGCTGRGGMHDACVCVHTDSSISVFRSFKSGAGAHDVNSGSCSCKQSTRSDNTYALTMGLIPQ